MSDLYTLILAGGSGARLWPMSRQLAPKQLINLTGELSLFLQTVKRVESRVPAERMLFITSADLEAGIKEQLRSYLGSKRARSCMVVGEPMGRNTAPAVLLGAKLISDKDPDALMLVAPSDHVILDQSAFITAVDEAIPAAAKGSIVTFGLKPTRPETGYGYIRSGDEQGEVLKVERFEEKPDIERAKELFDDRRYLWNSGIFLFSVKAIMEEARKFLPQLMEAMDRFEPGAPDGLDGLPASLPDRLRELYEKIDPISIDHGIMEHTDRAAVKPVSMGWSDLGSWDSFYEMNDKDMSGNIVMGDAVSLDNEGCLIAAGNRFLGVVGMKDTIVVQTEDATLLCPRGRSQEVRRVVEHLEEKGRAESVIHRTVTRPWGSYTVLEEGKAYKVKRIVVDPGQRLSLQLHRQRGEHWTVVEGEGVVTLGETRITIAPEQVIHIPVETKHRVENTGHDPLVFIEVQSGDYLGEDDITRYDDDYGREIADK